jgi:outer membrane protein assembly factor BamB
MTIRRIVAALLVLLAGYAGWQVLRPAEVLAAATGPDPVAISRPPGVTGKTAAAPLIVAGRIRVFAAKRQVRADAPVDAKTANTPRWSYRRWPAQLTGVVAVGRTVITRWSDGRLVAIDAGSGRIAWRADGPHGGGYTGARTGAATVWNPPGLHTAGDTVLVTDRKQLVALDAGTGRRRWQVAAAGDCFGTVGGAVACGDAILDGSTGGPVADPPAGPFTALGCDVAASGCAGLRDAAGHGWLTTGGPPRRATALDVPGSTAAGDLALAVSGGSVVARSALDGAERWRWAAPAGRTVTVLGARSGAVVLLTGDRELVIVDAATGTVRSTFVLALRNEKTAWSPGRWQVADGYAAVERLDDPDPASVHHYFAVEPVVIAAI